MAVNYSYLRPLKAERMKQQYEGILQKRDNLDVRQVDGAVILPMKRFDEDGLLFGRGGVIDSEGKYVECSGIERRFCGKYDVEEPDSCEEEVIYGGYFVNHWGHFLVEAVTRLWLALRPEYQTFPIVFSGDFMKEREIVGNYDEFFELLGIRDRIRVLTKPCKYKKVIIPERSFVSMNYYSDDYKQIFDVVRKNAGIARPNGIQNGKIFLSRSHFAKAKDLEIGIEQLDEFFGANGYQIIYPEEFPLTALVSALSSAAIIAAESGSCAHNFLFAQDEKETILVERFCAINEFQMNINQIRNFTTTYIDGNIVLYPVLVGEGPFWIFFSKEFQRYINDSNMVNTTAPYISDKSIRSSFRRFLYQFQKYHGFGFKLEKMVMKQIDLLGEAYLDSTSYLGKNMKPAHLFRSISFCRYWIGLFVKPVWHKIKHILHCE